MQDLKAMLKKRARQNGMLVVVLVIVLFFQVITKGGHLKTHEHRQSGDAERLRDYPGHRYDVLYPDRGETWTCRWVLSARSAARSAVC